MSYHRKGFTLLEVTLVSGLMALLAVLISSAWVGVGRPAADLITRAEITQEMDSAVAALSRDLGGSLADPSARLGGKKLGRWVGWMEPSNTELWLCFDTGTDPNETADWASPDTVIVYYVDSNTLIRLDQNAGTTFTVARDVASIEVTPLGLDAVTIVLSFTYRDLTRTCTLIAKMP